jgi:hypothetical protein
MEQEGRTGLHGVRIPVHRVNGCRMHQSGELLMRHVGGPHAFLERTAQGSLDVLDLLLVAKVLDRAQDDSQHDNILDVVPDVENEEVERFLNRLDESRRRPYGVIIEARRGILVEGFCGGHAWCQPRKRSCVRIASQGSLDKEANPESRLNDILLEDLVIHVDDVLEVREGVIEDLR